MSAILNKSIVLVLNRNWQAINIRTPAGAFCQMATNAATALDIEGESHIRPVAWNEWLTLPVREGDNAMHTTRGAIRVPTVIVAVNFSKVPKKRPKLNARDIRERDGNRCQYTGRLLHPADGSLDHVIPQVQWQLSDSDLLRELVNVSALKISVGDPVSLSVSKADGQKCERCWHWETDIGQNAEHPTICGRCIEAVKQFKA